MKTLRNHIPIILMGVLTLAAIGSLPNCANADEPSRWQVKAGLAIVDASEPFSIAGPSGARTYAGGNAELGLGLSIEYQWSDLIGVEFGTTYAKSPDINETSDGGDDIGEGPSFQPVFASLNFYLTGTDNLDVYAGPRIAYVMFGDFDLEVDGENLAFEVDDELAWGATLGVNYRFDDSRWSVVAEATYLAVDMAVSERGSNSTTTSDFDPVTFNVGVSYRF